MADAAREAHGRGHGHVYEQFGRPITILGHDYMGHNYIGHREVVVSVTCVITIYISVL